MYFCIHSLKTNNEYLITPFQRKNWCHALLSIFLLINGGFENGIWETAACLQSHLLYAAFLWSKSHQVKLLHNTSDWVITEVSSSLDVIFLGLNYAPSFRDSIMEAHHPLNKLTSQAGQQCSPEKDLTCELSGWQRPQFLHVPSLMHSDTTHVPLILVSCLGWRKAKKGRRITEGGTMTFLMRIQIPLCSNWAN